MKTSTRTPWLVILTLCFLAGFGLPANAGTTSVERWAVYELSLQGPADGNPYMEVSLHAEFANGSHKVKVRGFYDGAGTYRVRFSPDHLGRWKYATHSNRKELEGRKGSFVSVRPTGNNHGPVRVTNTFNLEHADGSPFYSVGTTAYQWTSVKKGIQDRTLESLSKAPFNKIRRCVFPKNYRFGNDSEPWALAFERNGDVNDLTRPNLEFFQNFDHRVRQLMEMGVQADVILFHPYDRWGYSKMGKEANERYVRYMIARLSAYRNVWWSLANEWDIKEIKDTIDWDGIGTLLQREDPYQRLRGIHNWFHDDPHFFDHTRPWVTHVSTQTYFFFKVGTWRERYRKPILFDEMRYEGDVLAMWGSLTAQQMTSYFWMAGLSGAYPTHGDTFRNDADKETEVRWWAKGGTLMGDSPARIAFFRNAMEDAPVTKMTPRVIRLSDEAIPDVIPDRSDHKWVDKLNDNIYVFAKEAAYYLVYTPDAGRKIQLDLAGSHPYRLQVLDTWNMSVQSEKEVPPGPFSFDTQQPFTALRLTTGAHK